MLTAEIKSEMFDLWADHYYCPGLLKYASNFCPMSCLDVQDGMMVRCIICFTGFK